MFASWQTTELTLGQMATENPLVISFPDFNQPKTEELKSKFDAQIRPNAMLLELGIFGCAIPAALVRMYTRLCAQDHTFDEAFKASNLQIKTSFDAGIIKFLEKLDLLLSHLELQGHNRAAEKIRSLRAFVHSKPNPSSFEEWCTMLTPFLEPGADFLAPNALHVNHMLLLFGLTQPESDAVIKAVLTEESAKKGKQVEARDSSARWLAKIFAMYGVRGCMADDVHFIYASMKGFQPGVHIKEVDEKEIVDLMDRFDRDQVRFVPVTDRQAHFFMSFYDRKCTQGALSFFFRPRWESTLSWTTVAPDCLPSGSMDRWRFWDSFLHAKTSGRFWTAARTPRPLKIHPHETEIYCWSSGLTNHAVIVEEMNAQGIALVCISIVLTGLVACVMYFVMRYDLPRRLYGPRFPVVREAELDIKADIRVLLTMYGVPQRQAMYQEVVEQWLKNTNLHIYAVNSGGESLGVQHERFHEYVFTQEDEFVSPSYHEGQSILKALKHFRFPETSIVLKITAKYFCPELERFLKGVGKDTNILIQSRHKIVWNNTEILGMRPGDMKELMSTCVRDKKEPMESHLFHMVNTRQDVLRLPKLVVTGRNQRNNGDILEYL